MMRLKHETRLVCTSVCTLFLELDLNKSFVYNEDSEDIFSYELIVQIPPICQMIKANHVMTPLILLVRLEWFAVVLNYFKRALSNKWKSKLH